MSEKDSSSAPLKKLCDDFVTRNSESMYSRFTDRARKVMTLADEEAKRMNHEYVGTEHILLGLVKEGSGVGSNVLRNAGIDLYKVRLEVYKLVKSDPDSISLGKLPLSPRTKKVVDYAIDEAKSLNHNYVGTEHLLLGLIREEDGVAATVLKSLGLKLEEVRAAVLRLLGINNPDSQQQEKEALRETIRKTLENPRSFALVCIQLQTALLSAATSDNPSEDDWKIAELGIKLASV